MGDEKRYVIAWKMKGKRRAKTYHSTNSFLFDRAHELANYANQHFTNARHWPIPIKEIEGV